MSKFSNKIVSAALTLVMASMVMMSAPAVNAQSTADLQAQISALLAQIAQLQAQLNQGGTSSGTACYSFSRSLTTGMTGSDVKDLQVFLNGRGYVVASSGAGSVGNESTYFGALTKAAVAKFQAANAISPAVGYFGPVTRAKVNSMCTTTPGTPGTPVIGAGLNVRLSSSNPAANSLISSSASAAARVPVLTVDLTAGTASGVTVSDISFTKNGVLSDSSISGAYIEENGKVLAQYNSISSGKINFVGLGMNIAAGQTRQLTLSIDPASGLSAGNTVSFSLASSADVKSTDANSAILTASGTFPATGNIFTVTSVSNPSLATLTVASSSVGTEVTAGTNDNVVGAWNFTAGNSKVWLKSLNFKVIGSANKSDIRNVKLFVNGAQVGSTLSAVSSDGTAFFELSSASVALNTGSNSIQLHADISGSPSYNFQFEILNSYDILATDSQYNVPVSGQSNTGTQITIKTGSLTVQVASDTPTGNIAAGQTGVTLAKFTIYAGGEAVKIKWLGWGLNFTNASSQLSIDSQVKNVSLVDDAGGQVGSTVNTLSTTVTCTDTAYANSTSSYRNCLGNSSSPINYIIPANTTRVLSLKGDVQSTASFGTIAALLTGNTSNGQGLTSSQVVSTGSANGSAMTFSSNALTVAKNSSVGTQTITANSAAKRIGSYTLTASSAEGVKVSTVTILMGAGGASFQNLKVMVGGTQFGSTQSVLGASTSYTFSGTSFTVAKGQSVTLDVYADVLSSATAGTKATITTLSGCSANGEGSLASISCSSTAGQDVVVAGQATIQVAVDSATPAANQIVMGTSGQHLATFRITETSNVEDVKITDMNVFQLASVSTTVKSAFGNVKLYKSDGTLLGTAASANTSNSTSTPGRGYYYKFNFSSPLVVPQSGSVSVLLKGDVSSYSSSGATDNSTHVFKIASSTNDTDNDLFAGETVNALGSTSNATSAVTLATGAGAPTSNAMTVLRTKLTLASAALGTTSGRAKASVDDLGTITFTADASGSASLNTITVTFGGDAPSISTFLDGVSLLDANGTNVTNTSGVTVATSTACSGANTCTKTWSLGDTTSGWIISAGTPYTFKIRLDSTKTQAGASGVSRSLSASVNATTDIMFTDALDSAASTRISPPANTVPLNINSVSYAQGS